MEYLLILLVYNCIRRIYIKKYTNNLPILQHFLLLANLMETGTNCNLAYSLDYLLNVLIPFEYYSIWKLHFQNFFYLVMTMIKKWKPVNNLNKHNGYLQISQSSYDHGSPGSSECDQGWCHPVADRQGSVNDSQGRIPVSSESRVILSNAVQYSFLRTNINSP